VEETKGAVILRGDIRDIAVNMVFLFTMGLVLTILYLIFSSLSGTRVDVYNIVDSVLGMLVLTDTILLFVTVVVAIISLGFANSIKIDPTFLPLNIMLLIFVTIISVIVHNSWEAWATNATIATVISYFPTIQTIMSYLPQLVLGYGALLLIVLHGKPAGWGDPG